jgi:hypothetical protein
MTLVLRILNLSGSGDKAPGGCGGKRLLGSLAAFNLSGPRIRKRGTEGQI